LFEEIINEAAQMLTVMFWIFIASIIIYGAAWVYMHKTADPNSWKL